MKSKIVLLKYSLAIFIFTINCASLGPEYDEFSNKWYHHIHKTYEDGMDMSEYNAYVSISFFPNGYFHFNRYYGTNHSIIGSYVLKKDSLFIYTENCENLYELYKYSIEDETLNLEFILSECDDSLNVQLSRSWSFRKPNSWPNNAL